MQRSNSLDRGHALAGSSPERPHLQPSLLPPFEPLSSPTSLPKLRARTHHLSPSTRAAERRPYPTPVPTSSTILPPSSSPARATRPSLLRNKSTLTDRAPLGELPTAQLARDGTPTLFGRSSNSSHFQLSANRLISRIHIEAWYELPSEEHENGRVWFKCLGWNGARVKCKDRGHFLDKGETFAVNNPSHELMLDVQDARVIVKWPPTPAGRAESEFTGSTAHPSPARTVAADFPSSPPVGPLHSPISPSPRRLAAAAVAPIPMASLEPSGSQVEIYEDEEAEGEPLSQGSTRKRRAEDTFRDFDGEEDMRFPSQSAASFAHEQASHASSVLSSPEDLSDHDEENDPYIASFSGPYGPNLLPRMASMQAGSPQRRPLQPSTVTPTRPLSFVNEASSPSKPSVDLSPIRNHVVNQLAFSRVHALPLGTIYTNLPASFKEPKSAEEGEEKRAFTREDLRKLLDVTAAVGEIAREGKDAAGKPLEDEFYYVPELDTDTMRQSAVQTSLGKTSMRAVRKQHKQYYWKRPRY